MEPEPIGTRTERGWELRQEARGFGRYFMAAFLLVWLAGWAVGETMALVVLARGVSTWVRNGAPLPGQAPIATIAIAAFLLVWLSLWTLGGIMALRELLRVLWGGTAVIAGVDGVTVERWAGPFRSRKHVPRDTIQAVRIQPRGTLGLETTSGGVDLLRSTKAIPLERFASELRRELGIVGLEDASAMRLPAGWAEVVTPEGVVAVTHDPANRRRQAAFMAALTLAVSTVALLSTQIGQDTASRWSLAIVFGIATAAFGAATLWLARGRNEWRVGSGRLVLQRRFGDRTSERFTALGLELSISTDSDGDEWFSLDATADPPDPSAPPPAETTFVMGRAVPERRQVRRIASQMNDASVPRALGRWLAARGDVPFLDRTRLPQSRTVDIAELRAKLAASGSFGAFIDRLIGPALERQEKKDREGSL